MDNAGQTSETESSQGCDPIILIAWQYRHQAVWKVCPKMAFMGHPKTLAGMQADTV